MDAAERASRLVGLPVNAIRLGVYILSGMLADLGSHAPAHYRVLNACRDLHFMVEGRMCSKLQGVAWARSRLGPPWLLDAAAQWQQHGTGPELVTIEPARDRACDLAWSILGSVVAGGAEGSSGQRARGGVAKDKLAELREALSVMSGAPPENLVHPHPADARQARDLARSQMLHRDRARRNLPYERRST